MSATTPPPVADDASAFGTPLLIANPGAGRPGQHLLDRLVTALNARGVAPDVEVTGYPGHAALIARSAAIDGRQLIVAVGGDGTVHEVVNGMVDASTGTVHGDDPVLGVVPTGSGSDFVRTFGLDRAPEVLARHLVTADTIRVDVGRLRARGPRGGERVRLFINVAQAGYGADVVRLAGRMPRWLHQRRYPLAAVLAVPRFRRGPIAVTTEGTTTTAPLCNVVVANGQFFGGGMRVAPRALPTDGKLDVQTWGGRPADVIGAQRQLRAGTHVARDDVDTRRATEVTIDAAHAAVVEVDGEAIGTTPAHIDVLPGVLRFKL